MLRSPSRILLALGLFILLPIQASAQSWGCYDPKPGHPTDLERADFIRKASDAALEAERHNGTPAAALAAMAIAESGYGWTRTSLDAHNFFGWKYVSAVAASGRGSYTLTCQPAEDVNNHYVKFADLADAMEFVSSKLAMLPAYRADTKAYQNARRHGTDPKAAVDAWVAGIADPYNWRPQAYAKSIQRLMNNPFAPSDQLAAQTNLYKLSEALPYEPDSSASLSMSVAPVGYNYALTKVRPWAGTCESAPILDHQQWEGFPLRRCTYHDIGATVTALMLNADQQKIAMWFATACQDAAVANFRTCIDHLATETSQASSMGVFPVAGFIPEPEYGGKCFLFRDGVTVHTASYPINMPPKSGSCGPETANDEKITSALKFARITSTTRSDYIGAGGREAVGKVGDVRWADVVRTLYQQAWNSPRNELISARAIADRKSGIIK